MKTLPRSLVWLVLPLLAACGSKEAAAPAARPVLVEVVGQQGSGQAFAGEVRARQESVLAFQVPGRLVARHVDAGAVVRAGQVLAELDASDYRLQASAAQAELAAAEAELARVRDDLARFQALSADQLVSRSSLAAQEAAFTAARARTDAARANLAVTRNQAGYAQLRAPADGVVASRQAEVGQVLAAGQPVLTVAADSGREVLIALPESRVAEFAVGQPAEVELWSAPQRRLPAEIREIAAAADPATRSYAARVALAPAVADQAGLGQSARVYIAPPSGQALSVPLAAVQGLPGTSDAHVLVVDPASGSVSQVAVQVQRWGSERAELAAGLQPGQWVVAAGGHLLRAGETVRAVDRDNRPLAAPASTTATDGN